MTEYLKWDEEYITRFIELIQNERHLIVPVIGTGVYYVKQDDGRISIHEFVFQNIVEEFIKDEYKEIVRKECTGDDLRRMKKLGVRLQLFGKRDKMNQVPSIYSCISKLLSDPTFVDQIQLDENVRTFLQYGHFPLIITTCYIKILNNVLIGPKGQDYIPIGYYCQSTQDVDIDNASPTVFHLFGCCEEGQEPMVTEDDFLKYLHFLHSSAPKKLKSYLQNRTILSLGCNVPDWAFRFILLSLMEQKGKLCSKTNLIGGAVKDRIEEELQEFLCDISYLSGDDIASVLVPINNATPRPSLFLSYSAKEGTHEMDGIMTIRKKLEAYFTVWFFPEQSKETYGEQYWDRIQEGLEKCDVFLPVITKGMIERLKQSSIGEVGPVKDKDDGFLCEWWMMSNIRKSNQCCIAYFLDSDYNEVQQVIRNNNMNMDFLLNIFSNASHISDSPASFDPSNFDFFK